MFGSEPKRLDLLQRTAVGGFRVRLMSNSMLTLVVAGLCLLGTLPGEPARPSVEAICNQHLTKCEQTVKGSATDLPLILFRMLFIIPHLLPNDN